MPFWEENCPNNAHFAESCQRSKSPRRQGAGTGAFIAKFRTETKPSRSGDVGTRPRLVELPILFSVAQSECGMLVGPGERKPSQQQLDGQRARLAAVLQTQPPR